MKTATVSQLKKELNQIPQPELVELCLRLSKFKKENKELLTYLLYEASNEDGFIEGVKEEISLEFTNINTNSYHYIKKSVRKILRRAKTYIRYSKQKETEVALLLHFCKELKAMQPSYTNNVSLTNIFNRQITAIHKALVTLHEDLQYDYRLEMDNLLGER